MSNSSWSLKWKIAFIVGGLALGSISTFAFADEPGSNQACITQSIPGILNLHYSDAGQLTAVEDLHGRTNARLEFRGSALDDISITHFIKDLKKPDHYGRTEQWGPARWSEYDLGTGKLKLVNIYEKGRQLSFTIPADTDFEQLRDSKTGAVQFTGAPESCDVSYSDCKTLKARTLTLTEPLHFDAKASDGGACVLVAGMKVALKNSAPTNPGIDQDQTGSVKQIPGNGSNQVCVDKVCITVLDDDSPSTPTELVPAN